MRSSEEAVLGRLAGIDPATVPAESLAAEITAACRLADRMTGEALRLLGALDATGGAAAVGCASTAQFARQFLRMLPAHASQFVATARTLRTLERTSAALRAGDLGYDHAVVIAHTADRLDGDDVPRAESVLVEAAVGGASPADVRRLGTIIRHRVDPDGADREAARQHDRRHLSISELRDGTWRLEGTLDPTTGLVVKTAVEAFARPAGGADPRTPGQRRADGLAAACNAALDGGTLAQRHEVRPHVNLTVDQATLATTPGAGGSDSGGSSGPGAPPATTGYRTHLTGAAALALTCDATVSTITVDGDATPLDVARAVRVITPALRRAVETRDQGCRWPGCETPAAWTTPHHIRHWARGGHTRLDNLILLCWTHHVGFVHTQRWAIAGDPNGTVRITSPDGRITLTSHPPGPPVTLDTAS